MTFDKEHCAAVTQAARPRHNVARRRNVVLTASLFALALSACGTDSKAERPTVPLTITIADSQAQGRPSNLPLGEFAAQVASLSKQSMQVQVVYTASANEPVPGSDGPIIDKLRAGDFQMAVIPTRAWTAAGVATMQALQAPFLVQSDQQMVAIAHDTSLVSGMLAGLDEIGVHGLTIFPESLRHFFSFTSPILTPADVKGRQIRYLSAPDVAELLQTLGATPVEPPYDDFVTAVQDGSITAADGGFATGLDTNPRPATVTGNLTLYPKMISLVTSAKFWQGLTAAQQRILAAAAQASQDWAIANRTEESEAAASYCAGGGTVVLAEAGAVADFRAAAAPIYSELAKDDATKRTIAAIDALAADGDRVAIEACAPVTSVPAEPDVVVARPGELPNGIYRVELTDDFLRSIGQNEKDVHEDHGVLTFRMKDGHMSWDQAAEDLTTPARGDAVYQVEGNNMFFQWGENMGGAILQFTWTVDADGTLHFTQTDFTADANWFFLLPWPRVGDT